VADIDNMPKYNKCTILPTPVDRQYRLIVFTNTVAISKAITQVCIEFGACSIEISSVVHLSKSAVYFSYEELA
jgi:hypothetical protein